MSLIYIILGVNPHLREKIYPIMLISFQGGPAGLPAALSVLPDARHPGGTDVSTEDFYFFAPFAGLG
jgi:hypothetical protein